MAMSTVGIDIGGTQLRAAIFDDGKMLDVFKTTNDRGLSAEENMDKLINYIEKSGYEVSGIGIGCPGPLDMKAGKVLTPPNLMGWDNFEIVKYVEGKTGIKTVLNNDANVAGLAEAIKGAGAGYESVVYITLSTGVGGAYIYRGELVNGAHSNAAEFWIMLVNEDVHYHKNALPGCLNEQASGSGIASIASEKFGRLMSTQDLFDLYHDGVPAAVDLLQHSADAMARGIANITCTIDPDVIVIGGGVAIHHPDYVEMVCKASERYVVDPAMLNFKMAEYGDDAGLLGASLLV